MIQVNKENVIIETVKKAEDSNDIIIRLYECYNRRSDVCIDFYRELDQVVECNMVEKEVKNISVNKKSFCFQMKPYEIKTFKLKMR
jgi:alpha-mannosidase